MTLQEQAAQLVASGGASTIESAVWSITHKAGYVHGRSDAQAGTARDITGAREGYAAGYASGYKWGAAHPVPAAHAGYAVRYRAIDRDGRTVATYDASAELSHAEAVTALRPLIPEGAGGWVVSGSTWEREHRACRDSIFAIYWCQA